ncbi:MAG: 50S ribosomal protein L18 [Candidatus Marinimicrobia bacterium]|mgnify:CR=1 FL=1|jgi:large subunit ribosomal protein L18|nr:50S ribosomal protein L18 [Candidatus Neomarinimicrobiota bacterium]MBT3796640.1 50S ribosomal protein L18 [Candidatus Neomarinimicrobiota bacterium]MBT4149170.1 50S ribosomal protein L18 [Candidatus Neomarinimicrobiota bacterium]MBT4785128.1 50S ribosomal protein L18 [Candidatus Neomarinimicrobiota bacterium]MBT5440018.1 50S ribosomal protein L18 [Candidatus Neomarinimicrobiota bacterium]|tara:strand:- start:588 stop:959 length:372 start_codon:yes stop_codon:yes gene_type:complete
MKKMSTNEMRNDRRRNRSKRNNIAHPSRPRLVVYRSNKHISAQVINDHDGNTLASASSLDKTIEKLVIKAKSKIDVSILVGKTLAERALKNKVIEVVFDRNGYPYHGRVKAVADAAREAGLKF